jgi:hypothetical protein
MSAMKDTLIRNIEDGRALFAARYAELFERANKYFRDYRPEARDEAIANVMAMTWEDFTRLIERALADDTLLTTTFYFACKRTRSGRMAGKASYSGGKELWNHGTRHSLNMDAFVSDRTGVFDTVRFKLDTETWFERLSDSDRSYALEMSDGLSTSEIAQRHQVSSAAVSMRRAKIKTSYQEFMKESE